MKYDEFVGRVQQRAHLASNAEAIGAIRATLQTLAERLAGGEANDLASQLPRELAHYLREPQRTEAWTLDEFFERVSKREQVDLPDSVHHSRAVISVLVEAVSPGEIEDILAQLPEEYEALFSSAQAQLGA